MAEAAKATTEVIQTTTKPEGGRTDRLAGDGQKGDTDRCGRRNVDRISLNVTLLKFVGTRGNKVHHLLGHLENLV